MKTKEDFATLKKENFLITGVIAETEMFVSFAES